MVSGLESSRSCMKPHHITVAAQFGWIGVVLRLNPISHQALSVIGSVVLVGMTPSDWLGMLNVQVRV